MASWSKRFAEQRIAGLYSRHLGQVATVLTPELEARILEATRRAPSDGATHWSTRKLAGHLQVSHMMVARVWRKHGLQPHQSGGIHRCRRRPCDNARHGARRL
ncbi:MAG: helix-turn-helix domain-containing protein [Steroidobacteraceae bacterium]